MANLLRKKSTATRPVLLVEDDDDLRHSLGALLELRGYAVEAFETGRLALERLRRRGVAPAIVIMDLSMPEMDGWALRRAMLARRDLAAVPVIVVSAHEDAEKSLRASAHLKKPFDAGELCRLVDAHT